LRIDSFTLINFKGVRHAETSNLASTPVVTISGPNGAGKSLLLEAIAAAWFLHLPSPETLVGPWGDEARIELSFSFLPEELDALQSFMKRDPGRPEFAATLKKTGGTDWNRPSWADLYGNPAFQAQHGFLRLDLLPADRSIPREPVGIDPGLLGREKTEQFRLDVMRSVFRNRAVVQLSGVQSYLASLDYLELLSRREGRDTRSDFDLIASAFYEATNKRLGRPRPDNAQGAVIPIGTPAGVEHSIHDLSSGEQEVLGIMYFI